MRAASLIVLLGLLAGRAHAGGLEPYRRYAIVVGSRYGAEGDVPLRFAHKDAQAMAQVLRELGGVRQSDLVVLLDPDAVALTGAFVEIAKKIASSRDPALFVFYYSGHADGQALHLGPSSRLAWSDLTRALHDSPATLRLGVVDACQAGSLTAAKGFTAGPAAAPPDPTPSGTAVLVAASSVEVAQESVDLGGSVFTHYLVSALRGAGDADGDGLVTLAEANAFASRLTRSATAAWAPRVQHPFFDLELSGHGEVVLADLHEGAARVALGRPLVGHLVVIDKPSQAVLVEADKVAGQPLSLALPAGRYQLHLRTSDVILVAELELPWGGSETLDGDAFARHSYQEVAMKGGVIEVHDQRLVLDGSAQLGVVPDLGPVLGLRLGWGRKLGELELGVVLGAAWGQDDTVDTTVASRVLTGGLSLTYEQPRRRVDLRLGLLLEAQLWQQHVDKAPDRQSVVPGASLLLGIRLPFARRLFLDTTLAVGAYLPALDGGRRFVAGGSLGLGVGAVF